MTLAILRATVDGRIAIIRMGENTREAARYAALAQVAEANAAASASTAMASANYYPTIAAGIAATSVGDGFSSGEGGSPKLYERTGTSPFYTEIAELDGFLRADLADTATGKGASLVSLEDGTDLESAVMTTRVGRIENKAALRNLLVSLYNIGQTPGLMTVVTDGDSVSPRVGEHVAINLRERYGDGGVVYPIQSNTADYGTVTVVHATTGTVTQGVVGDATYKYLPNNAHFIMQNGATLTFRAQNNHATFSRIFAWLAKRPGDGSALLEVRKVSDSSVVASWNTGSLDGADGTLVKANGGAHFTGLDSTIPYELRITATGTVCVLTAAFLRDAGVVLYQAGLGGSPVSKQLPALQGAAWQGIMADLNARFMLHEDKTEDAGASYDAHIAAWAAMPNVSCLYIGSLPDSTSAASQIAVKDALRTKVLAAGMAFIDGYAILKDYAELTRLGLNNDGVHALTAAYWTVANVITSELHLADSRLGLLLQKPVRASEYRMYRGDGFGGQDKHVRFAGLVAGVNRVNIWNVNYIGLKSNQTETTDSPTAQVRLSSYSNFGALFATAAGGAAWLNNVAAIAFGTAAGTGNSSAQLTFDYNNNRVTWNMTTAGGSNGAPVMVCGGIRVGSVNMLTAQQTGWTAATGTANKGAYATYAGATISATYTQAEVQALDNAARDASQRIKALEDALRSLGLIN